MKLSSSRNARILLTNLLSLSALQLVRYILPLIILPYISSVIGVKRFGDIAIANAMMLVVQAIVNYGFDFTGARDVARMQENKERISQMFSDVIWARCMLFLVAFGVTLFLIYSVPILNELGTLIIVTVIGVFFTILFPEWLYQGLEQMQYITIINVVARLFFVIAVFCFVKSEEDYLYYPLFNSLSFLVAGVVSMYIIIHNKKIRLLRPHWNNIIIALRDSFDLFVNQLCSYLYQYLPSFFLGVFKSSQSAGVFDAGSRLVQAGTHGMDVITRTFFPYLSKRMSKHALYARLSMSVAMLVSLILYFGAPLLFDIFYTDDFEEGIVVMKVLAISLFFTNLGSVYGVNYLILLGQERILRNVTVVLSLLGVLFLIPAIYYWDYVGAAYVILSVRGVLGITLYMFALKSRNNVA